MSDLAKIERDIGRLEAKVDILLERDRRDDERLTKLESDATAQKAVVGVVGAIAGGISAFASKYLGIT
jgi:hypothetical protein